MGALSIFRKRANECLGLSIDSIDKSCVPNQTGTNSSKKRRISCFNRVPVDKVVLQTTVSRLQKYPEPVARSRREVHAPCRSNRVGFSSSLSNGGVRVRASETPVKEGSIMGNVFGSARSLWRDYEASKRDAFNTLRHVTVEKREAVLEGSHEVVIIEESDEERSVSSDKRRRFENNGLGLVIESRDSDKKGLENLVVNDGNVLHSPMLNREAYKKLLSSVEKYTPKLKSLDFEIKSHEAKWEAVRSEKKQRDARKLEKLKKPEEDLLREAFVPLSEEEEAEVKRALLSSNRRQVLVTHENSNIEISGETLQCLRPGAWLNDEVINVYLELLKEREKREPKKYLTCHFFSTFFYKKLIGGRNGYDYKAVKRWTSMRKLGYKLNECDKIFVPIHKQVHWCLAIINKKDKKFQYLDSLGGRDSQVLRVLAKYYVDELKDKCEVDIDVTSWELEYVEDLPEQQNGFDCGVFMIKYADFYSRGTGLHFSQENMPYFRRRTAKEILRLQAH